MKPKLRTGHEIIHLERGVSIVGSLTYGLGQEIRDPSGSLLSLNDILDGTREAYDAMREFVEISGLSAERVARLFAELDRTGHIEDADSRTALTAKEQERYSRSANFFSWISKVSRPSRWDAQEILKRSRVCVLGVGGVGGAIASQLVSTGVGVVTVIDFDDVELSNLNRQTLFTDSDVGRPKAETVARRLSRLNTAVDVEFMNEKVDSVARLVQLFEGHDLFFRAADSPDELPFLTSDAAIHTRKPWIDCSYNGPMVVCCTYVPGVTGCNRCIRDLERKRLTESGRGAVYSDHVPETNSAIGPVTQIAGSLAALEGIRLLAGYEPQTVGRALHQNMYRYEHRYSIEIPTSCPHA